MKIILDDHIRLYEVVHGMKQYSGEDIELFLPEGSVFKSYHSNLSLLEKVAQRTGKKIHIVHEGGQPMSVQENSEPSEESTESVLDDKNELKQADTPIAKNEKHKHHQSVLTPKRLIATFLIILLLAGLATAGFVLYYLPRGVVTLYVNQRVIEKSSIVTVDPDIQTIDESNSKIPGRKVETTIEQSETFPSSGKKQVGEKATGQVVIQNFRDSALELPVGTILKSGTLSYVLNKSVRVDEVTISEKDGQMVLDPGESSPLAIGALDIGETYNLSANSDFTVGEFKVKGLGSVRATNPQALTGGLTREVTVVSADDQSNALKQLKSKLQADAPTKVKSELKEGETFSDDMISFDTKFADYDHPVGAEASNFALTLKISASVVAFSESDVKELLSKVARDNIPDGFVVTDNEDSLALEKIEGQVNSAITVKAKLATMVVPDLNLNQIHDQLLNIRPAQAESILKSMEHVDGYDMNLWPYIPDAFRSMPHISDRLEVKVEVRSGNDSQT
ncbi:hypothetical protein HGA91_01285 [candidate division WWE3 bacterium]|nr:hypothetical protein [candidate division WWE3 bacterium]